MYGSLGTAVDDEEREGSDEGVERKENDGQQRAFKYPSSDLSIQTPTTNGTPTTSDKRQPTTEPIIEHLPTWFL